MSEGATDDRLLNGRVHLRQPSEGFRATTDSVLLAAAVPARSNETVLDVGAGTGAASLCLAVRVDGVQVTGIEMDRTLVRLAADNAEATGVAARTRFYLGDIANPPVRLSPASFDHVMANPPYVEQGTGQAPRDPSRAQAMVESGVRLSGWIDFCLRMVRTAGTVTLIQRADRLADVLAGLNGRLGALVIQPLWPGAGKAAKRVIVSGQKGSGAPLTLLPGLILHQAGGAYTDQIDAILRDAAPLDLAG
ncbi:MAG: methyltransferase [Rhodospirillales bacterium]|nr:methyltransferase [Rhodospirillales bacterium]